MPQQPARLPFSQACENNREPILGVLRRHLEMPATVIEVGSGTGQHAVYFAAELPHITWQPTDRAENLSAVAAWRDHAGLPNVAAPIELDVLHEPWPVITSAAVFSANTTHIMSWRAVEAFTRGVGRILAPDGLFFLYGPFNYGGAYTSASNAEFDAFLRTRDPASGIRAIEDMQALAGAAGLTLLEDNALPANNRLLVWTKRERAAR